MKFIKRYFREIGWEIQNAKLKREEERVREERKAKYAKRQPQSVKQQKKYTLIAFVVLYFLFAITCSSQSLEQSINENPCFNTSTRVLPLSSIYILSSSADYSYFEFQIETRLNIEFDCKESYLSIPNYSKFLQIRGIQRGKNGSKIYSFMSSDYAVFLRFLQEKERITAHLKIRD